MSNTISLTTYALRLRYLRNNDSEVLSNVRGHGDFLQSIAMYLQNRAANLRHDTDYQQLLRVSQHRSHNERAFSGLMLKGEYGYQADIYNVQVNKNTYQRQVSDAEMLPLYYYIRIPSNSLVGLVVLQRLGPHGMKTLFHRDLNEFVESMDQNLRVYLDPLTPSSFLNHVLENGHLTSLRMIRRSIPSDPADLLTNGAIEIPGTIDIRLTPEDDSKKRSWLINVKEFFSGKKELSEIVELRLIEPDTIKIELDLNGKKRTIDLIRPDSLTPRFDVTEEVQIDEDTGHPIFNSVDEFARQLSNDLLREIGADG